MNKVLLGLRELLVLKEILELQAQQVRKELKESKEL